MENDEWRAQAACKDQNIDIFFPSSDDDAGPARAICARCPVQTSCLEWAIATRQPDGIWGGLTETERRRIRRRRQAAARAA